MNTLRVLDRFFASSFAIPLFAICLFPLASAPSAFAQSAAGQIKPSIGTSESALKNAPEPPPILQEELLRYYRPLRDIAQSVDIEQPTLPLGQYKLVVAPSLNILSDAANRNLISYMKNDGHLILGQRTAVNTGDNAKDWITGLPREPIHVAAWPGGKKVAVCFVLYVEVWGHGHGPNFRSDMNGRDPDVVDESFRQYAIEWGIPRIGRLFNEQGMPLSIALNALFPAQHPDVWTQFRALVPKAPIIAHGMNNSTQLLPLGRGLDAQEEYIRRTLDMTEKDTGVRPDGWSSPSVYPNGDTFTATAAEGIRYSLDGMDSDTLSRLATRSGPLVLIPYPAITVDMGQYLARSKEPSDMERLWIDYVSELAREAEANPGREATVVAIGIHPFVMGTPAGAAALRRVLENFKQQKLVWVTDTQAVLKAAGEQR